MIVDRTGWKYQRVRVPQDVLVVIGAVLIGGPVGIGTTMTAFFCGPLIEFFSDHVNLPLVGKLAKDARERVGHPEAGKPGDPTKLI